MFHFFTLVLDGMPFIAGHIREFNKLDVPWDWSVVQGVAEPVADTSWCKPMPARLSEDGSDEYLIELATNHPRVKLYSSPSWRGKTVMCNTAVRSMTKPGVLMQIDSDEIWRADQLMLIKNLFDKSPTKNSAFFWCDYWIGPNIKILRTGDNNYGNRRGEWLRAWRFKPGQQFDCHEPPVLDNRAYSNNNAFSRDETAALGLVFQHYPYVLEKQVALKQKYYGYVGAVDQWKALQQNNKWPVRVRDWLRWVKDESIADVVCK